MSILSNVKSGSWWSGVWSVTKAKVKIAAIGIAIVGVVALIAYVELRAKMAKKATQQGEQEAKDVPKIDTNSVNQAAEALKQTLNNLKQSQDQARAKVEAVKQKPANNIEDAVADWNKEAKDENANQK